MKAKESLTAKDLQSDVNQLEETHMFPEMIKKEKSSIEDEFQFEDTQLDEMNLYPILFKLSGLYVKSHKRYPRFPTPVPIKYKTTIPVGSENQIAINLDMLDEEEKENLRIKPILIYEELRLDIDGPYPQMTVSGYMRYPKVNYIAKLKKVSQNTFTGKIWYKYGNNSSFPYTHLKLVIENVLFQSCRKVKVQFYGPRKLTKVSTYKYQSKYFRDVNFEYDCEKGVKPILSIGTHDHQIRPSYLPNENITLDAIYRRAGCNVSRAQDNPVPSSFNINGTWSNQELHDAMQVYWSKFSNAPNWALWTFFAKKHDMGNGLGGIMFDSIGPNERQGTAVFYDSFISNPPTNGDPNANASIKRMQFWTAAHEMGHAFNLAHSWQKSWGTAWIPLADEPAARSFMNYPYRVDNIEGDDAFFSTFGYRFTDAELLFMRHAPNEFVQMGNSNWFVNHGFSNVEFDIGKDLKLEVRLNKATNVVEYMEPVYVEIKLTNISKSTLKVDKHLIEDFHHLAIEIQKPNGQIECCRSFVKQLLAPDDLYLEKGKSIYNSFFISSSPNQWHIKESGAYIISANLFVGDKVYNSNKMELNVLNPKLDTQVVMSSQYFTDEVARILYFNGSKVLDKGNKTLVEIMNEIPESNVAMHAAVALATPFTKEYKTLKFEDTTPMSVTGSATANNASIEVGKLNNVEALEYLVKATSDLDKLMNSYGHIEAEKQLKTIISVLNSMKNQKDARAIQSKMIKKFEKRGIIDKVIKRLHKDLEKMNN